jgi:hypothetical protein
VPLNSVAENWHCVPSCSLWHRFTMPSPEWVDSQPLGWDPASS